jgi:hypothetical protein
MQGRVTVSNSVSVIVFCPRGGQSFFRRHCASFDQSRNLNLVSVYVHNGRGCLVKVISLVITQGYGTFFGTTLVTVTFSGTRGHGCRRQGTGSSLYSVSVNIFVQTDSIVTMS